MATNDLFLEAFNLNVTGLRCLRAPQLLDWCGEKGEKSEAVMALIAEYLDKGGGILAIGLAKLYVLMGLGWRGDCSFDAGRR